MTRRTQSITGDLEVEQIARALHKRGAAAESVALLRGALRRDGDQDASRALLRAMVANDPIAAPQKIVHLDFPLVDRWIRRGMLVEALALLGGTSLGSGEMGREWANLLGELLAPVPVDAEAALVEMYRQLLSGGASVALTLLEERSRAEPSLPAWASRRLELLRWMLLDNAKGLESEAPGAAPSLLAGALAMPLLYQGWAGAKTALEEHLVAHPDDGDARRTLEAVEAIALEIDQHGSLVESSPHTMPMVGHPAALMQLRMGNLSNAASLYRRMPDDDRASLVLVEVEVVMRALEGEPVVEDEFVGETTNVRSAHVFDEATEPDHVEDVEVTRRVRLSHADGKSPAVITELGPPVGIDFKSTARIPRADAAALELEGAGKLEEAEAIYRELARTDESGEWARRAEELRRRRAANSHDGVLVQVIKPVD